MGQILTVLAHSSQHNKCPHGRNTVLKLASKQILQLGSKDCEDPFRHFMSEVQYRGFVFIY
jgi:hypothetical protein